MWAIHPPNPSPFHKPNRCWRKHIAGTWVSRVYPAPKHLLIFVRQIRWTGFDNAWPVQPYIHRQVYPAITGVAVYYSEVKVSRFQGSRSAGIIWPILGHV